MAHSAGTRLEPDRSGFLLSSSVVKCSAGAGEHLSLHQPLVEHLSFRAISLNLLIRRSGFQKQRAT